MRQVMTWTYFNILLFFPQLVSSGTFSLSFDMMGHMTCSVMAHFISYDHFLVWNSGFHTRKWAFDMKNQAKPPVFDVTRASWSLSLVWTQCFWVWNATAGLDQASLWYEMDWIKPVFDGKSHPLMWNTASLWYEHRATGLDQASLWYEMNWIKPVFDRKSHQGGEGQGGAGLGGVGRGGEGRGGAVSYTHLTLPTTPCV